jgi:alpha-tubulin suppressor-like RCC1 family protein
VGGASAVTLSACGLIIGDTGLTGAGDASGPSPDGSSADVSTKDAPSYDAPDVAVADGGADAAGDGQGPDAAGDGQVPDAANDGQGPDAATGNVPVALSAGASTTCALLASGDLYCWGRNELGEVGSDDDAGDNIPHAVRIGTDSDGHPLEPIRQVGLGADHACALARTGSVYCWGSGSYGMLGDWVKDHVVYAPKKVTSISGYTAISVNGFSNCGIDGSSHALCWAAPIHVAVPPSDAHLSAGHAFACAWGSSVGATCWGNNVYGELGQGNYTTPLGPSSFAPGSLPIVDMAGGFSGTLLAITSDQSVWASGGNGYGELASGTVGQGQACADGTYQCVSIPQQALDPTGAKPLKGRAVAVGSAHACVIGVDDAVYCWGDNQYGQLGSGVTGVPRGLPVKVVGLP